MCLHDFEARAYLAGGLFRLAEDEEFLRRQVREFQAEILVNQAFACLDVAMEFQWRTMDDVHSLRNSQSMNCY